MKIFREAMLSGKNVRSLYGMSFNVTFIYYGGGNLRESAAVNKFTIIYELPVRNGLLTADSYTI